MFNILRKVRQIKQSFEDPNVLVAKIHKDFEEATDNAVKEADNIINSDSTRGSRLYSLGFKGTEEANKHLQKINTGKWIEYYNRYKQVYPFNKFIQHKDADDICVKYGLHIADIDRFIGHIPERNLIQIEQFNVMEEDGKRVDHNWYYKTVDYKGVRDMQKSLDGKGDMYGYFDYSDRWDVRFIEVSDIKKTHHFEKIDMRICASIKDFNTHGLVRRGHMLVPDPIVLQPVNYGYLIVTKWGLEGQDESLTNEKMN